MRARRTRYLAVMGLISAVFVVIGGLGVRAYYLRAWRDELEQAKRAVADGRFGAAREALAKLAPRWTNDGEVPFLLGECEIARGRREEALAAWSQVPSSSPYFLRATVQRATHLLNSGRYAQAEEAIVPALATAPEADRYPLERVATRIYSV